MLLIAISSSLFPNKLGRHMAFSFSSSPISSLRSSIFLPAHRTNTQFQSNSTTSFQPCPIHRRPRRTTPTMITLPWMKKKDKPKITLNLDYGFAYLAHPEKNTGEDAFFIEGNAAGVFDGVSGAFETRGVDPRLYSQTLAALTADNIKENGPENAVKSAIEAAAQNTAIGASTVCVIGVDDVGRMFGINLGDSGVRVVRNGKMIFRTKEQQHFFNCPYQLGTDSTDSIQMGQNVQVKLKEGDCIILATDGLFDNVFDREIVGLCEKVEDSMSLAERLAEYATEKSQEKDYVSPFMTLAMKNNVAWQGGKIDDVTVVAARVKNDPGIPAQSIISTIPEYEEAEPQPLTEEESQTSGTEESQPTQAEAAV